ncbi:MAG: LptA/OstA family protein [Rectinemataceae bacterium]|nr:LptA/OstA family protein [Rectinemataceae bacterium]
MKRKMSTAAKMIGLSLFAGLSLGFSLSAQNKTPAPVPAPSAAGGQAGIVAATPAAKDKSAKETLTFSATRVESVLAKGKERTVLTGKAKVLSGTLEIKADRIEITGENYAFIACTGTVEVRDPEKGFFLKTEKLNYDRTNQISKTEGASTLEDSKNDVILKAEWIEFDQKNENILAQISVFILKEDFAARSEYALFNRKDNTLIMTGIPTVQTRDASLTATTISGSASSDKLNLEGNVSGSIQTTKQETEPVPEAISVPESKPVSETKGP